jgi:hypothetical protein
MAMIVMPSLIPEGVRDKDKNNTDSIKKFR